MPPIQSANSADGQSGEAKSHSVSKEMYTADGDYIQDIEVNDLRNRYLLTKGSTQKMVNMHLHSTDFPDTPIAGAFRFVLGRQLALEISCLHLAR